MNARENPFAADRVLTIRYELPEGGAEALLVRLQRLGYRAAIVGPHGSGKTTLLEDLAKPLAARGFRIRNLRLDTEHRRFARGVLSRLSADLESRDVVCLDGAEQLDLARWLVFRWRTRRAGGLLITTHRRGRLQVLLECTTSPELLERIVRRLAVPGGAGLQPCLPHGPRIPSAAELFARHRGNLREALRELYDVHAGRSTAT